MLLAIGDYTLNVLVSLTAPHVVFDLLQIHSRYLLDKF